MTPAFSARRRADEFEALLSRLDGPDATLDGRSSERYGDLLTLVGELRAVPGPVPRADFAADLRERLMAEADTVLLHQPSRGLTSDERETQQKLALPVRAGNRRLAAALGSAAMVGAAATVAVAAQSALPGESLYPVKRGMEAAEHRLASDDAALGRALLASADRRLTELEIMATEERTGSETLIPDTLDAFSEQSEDGARNLLDAYDETGDSTAVEDLRAFTAASMGRLEEMESTLPASARDELVVAGRRLSDLDAAAAAACPVCHGGINELPDFLVTSGVTSDLLVGLDTNDVRLDPAPVSGLDVEGLVVPELEVPTDQVTGVPGVVPQTPGGTPVTGLPGGVTGSVPAGVPGDVKNNVTGNGNGNGNGNSNSNGGGNGTDVGSVPGTVQGTVEDTVKGVEDVVGGVTDGVDDVVTGTTETLDEVVTGTTGTLDEATGGAVGGVTGGLDDATGGLIGDLTGLPVVPDVELP